MNEKTDKPLLMNQEGQIYRACATLAKHLPFGGTVEVDLAAAVRENPNPGEATFIKSTVKNKVNGPAENLVIALFTVSTIIKIDQTLRECYDGLDVIVQVASPRAFYKYELSACSVDDSIPGQLALTIKFFCPDSTILRPTGKASFKYFIYPKGD